MIAVTSHPTFFQRPDADAGATRGTKRRVRIFDFPASLCVGSLVSQDHTQGQRVAINCTRTGNHISHQTYMPAGAERWYTTCERLRAGQTQTQTQTYFHLPPLAFRLRVDVNMADAFGSSTLSASKKRSRDDEGDEDVAAYEWRLDKAGHSPIS